MATSRTAVWSSIGPGSDERNENKMTQETRLGGPKTRKEKDTKRLSRRVWKARKQMTQETRLNGPTGEGGRA